MLRGVASYLSMIRVPGDKGVSVFPATVAAPPSVQHDALDAEGVTVDAEGVTIESAAPETDLPDLALDFGFEAPPEAADRCATAWARSPSRVHRPVQRAGNRGPAASLAAGNRLAASPRREP